MPSDKTDKQALAATQAFVTKQFVINGKEGVAQGTEETIAIHKFVTDTAKVEVSLGLTLNLGHYETARLNVGITVPCYKEETDTAYLYAKNWVANRIATEVESIREKKDTSIL